jgi:HAD superfamily phosphoserine phosphatase-like hydrolase
MIKAVILDIDDTLTDNVSWLKITELLEASVQEHERIFSRLTRNELTYLESKRQLFDLWKLTGNANKDFLTKAFSSWSIKDYASDLIQYCDSVSISTVLVTGSVDLFAEQIATILGVKHFYANTDLVWDNNGNLIDFNYERDQAHKKVEQFYDFINKICISENECVVLGDSENDIKLFEITKHGIAVSSKNRDLLRVAWHTIDSLSEAIEIVKEQS